MKLRIVKIPGWTPTKRHGIVLVAINELGFKEKATFVLQVHSWRPTLSGFEEIWEDVPILTQKEIQDEKLASSAG